MKHKIFLLLFIFNCLSMFAQFKLTPNGFVSENEPDKAYVVYDFENVDANTLYRKVISSINTMFVASENVINEAPGESININALKTGICQIKYIKKYSYDAKYNLIIKFKDGKIRFDAPIVRELYYQYDAISPKNYLYIECGKNSMSGSLRLYDKNCEPRYADAIKDIETFFNLLIKEIVYSTDQKNDDW